MKLLWNDKDGGPESLVWCWGIEIKGLFSILLLKFGQGSREAYHTHAFNCISWVLKGFLIEHMYPWVDGRHKRTTNYYTPSWHPIKTGRETFHMVEGGEKSNWVITFRGPWVNRWREYLPTADLEIELTHGRKDITPRCRVCGARKCNHCKGGGL